MHDLHQYKRLLMVIMLLAALLAIFQYTGLRSQVTLDSLQHLIRAHETGGLLLFILLFSLGNLIQIPGWIFLAAAVLTLGRTTGGLVTYIAACTSCTMTFLVIRGVGGDALRSLDNPVASRILGQLDTRPVQSIVMLRVLFQTLPAINYALAMSGVRLRSYLTGTLLGLPLPIALYCVFFDSLARHLIH